MSRDKMFQKNQTKKKSEKKIRQEKFIKSSYIISCVKMTKYS